MPDRRRWQFSDQVLAELGFVDPDVEEEIRSLLYDLAADPIDQSQLVQPVPGMPELMTVTFDAALLMYHIGPLILTALLLRQIPGSPEA